MNVRTVLGKLFHEIGNEMITKPSDALGYVDQNVNMVMTRELCIECARRRVYRALRYSEDLLQDAMEHFDAQLSESLLHASALFEAGRERNE